MRHIPWQPGLDYDRRVDNITKLDLIDRYLRLAWYDVLNRPVCFYVCFSSYVNVVLFLKGVFLLLTLFSFFCVPTSEGRI